ncbi:MAG: HAMP domain-containing histidine kinase, partial [Pseudobdellovibrionaceae bacterium]|nr:HAMP domain-containing histidine kinase [Pseudobdellovibrionaceae bacterium]
ASLNDIATGIADEADEAIRRLQQVTDLNLEQSKELIRQSKRTDSLATLMGAVVVVLVLISMPTIIWLLRRMIYRPVLEIASSLRNFRKHRIAGQPTSGAAELKAISTELSDMTSELTKQSQTQTRYLSAVAHDLRNPIAAIIMSTDLTLLEYGSEIPDDAKELLELIQRQSVHLERMVSDLLDTTRAESGDLELKKSLCDLNSLIKGCVDLFSCYSRSHTVVFESGTSLLLDIDPTRLTQVMNNLISNAIKYSPYGGQIKVAVLQGRTEAVVSVRDSGIGISVEDQETIFEPFRRASATKDTIPGVGLGLFTAKKIVMAHGGTIEVQSRVREGSTFEVHLPLSQGAHGSATPRDVKLTAAQETSDRRSHATLDSRTENLL